MSELAIISAKLDRLQSSVEQALAIRQKPMTIQAFADAVGLSSKTISRRIRCGAILTKGGRIPPSELRKFGV